jgi:hypothetical protein
VQHEIKDDIVVEQHCKDAVSSRTTPTADETHE